MDRGDGLGEWRWVGRGEIGGERGGGWGEGRWVGRDKMVGTGEIVER